jgi:hypothetical protein
MMRSGDLQHMAGAIQFLNIYIIFMAAITWSIRSIVLSETSYKLL